MKVNNSHKTYRVTVTFGVLFEIGYKGHKGTALIYAPGMIRPLTGESVNFSPKNLIISKLYSKGNKVEGCNNKVCFEGKGYRVCT